MAPFRQLPEPLSLACPRGQCEAHMEWQPRGLSTSPAAFCDRAARYRFWAPAFRGSASFKASITVSLNGKCHSSLKCFRFSPISIGIASITDRSCTIFTFFLYRALQPTQRWQSAAVTVIRANKPTSRRSGNELLAQHSSFQVSC